MIEFQHPAVLAWALVALVPLVLQWLRRRPQQETAWGAMMLLERAYQKVRARWRIHDRLRLLLQTGLVVATAVGLAGPRWIDRRLASTFTAPNRRPTHHLIVLDRSYSMRAENLSGTRFQRACELARQIVDQQPDGDRFSLWSWDGQVHLLFQEPVSRRADIHAALAALTPGMGRADIANLPRVIGNYLDAKAGRNRNPTADQLSPSESSSKNERRPGSRPGSDSSREQPVLWILTDLQQGTWTLDAADRAAWDELTRRVRLQILDIADPRTDNVAITSLQCDNPLVDAPSTIAVSLRNFDQGKAADRRVSVTMSGASIGSQRVTIPAGGSSTVSFSHVFRQAGTVPVLAQLDTDILATDDRRFAVVQVRHSIRVDIWEDIPDAARPLEAALLASGRPQERFDVRRVISSARLDAATAPGDVIALVGVSHLTSQEARHLQHSVRQGRGLVLFLPEALDLDSFRQNLRLDRSGQPFLPAEIGEPSEPGEFQFDVGKLTHPLVAIFRGPEQGLLASTPIWRYRTLTAWGNGEPVLNLQNGDAVLAAGPFGSGRVIVCAIPIAQSAEHEPWSALAAWPSFPPLVREMVQYAARHQQPDWTIGQPVEGTIPEFRAPLELVSPSNLVTRIDARNDHGTIVWKAGALDEPGIYRLGTPDDMPLQSFSVNVDPHEGDLNKVSATQLPRDRERVQDAHRLAATATAPWQPNLRELFLILAIILLVTEATLDAPDPTLRNRG